MAKMREMDRTGGKTDAETLRKRVEESIAELKRANEIIREESMGRRRADEALRFQRSIIDSMIEGVCLVRQWDNVIVYANRGFESQLGYEAGELVGKSVEMLGYEDEQPHGTATPRRFADQETRIARARMKDGTHLRCRIRTKRFPHPVHGEVWLVIQWKLDGDPASAGPEEVRR